MKKLLIITYYWPPSGGAGVQRWLRLSKYMSKQGVEVHVLTVNPEKASYSVIDERLNEDVGRDVIVHKTDTFEPLNYYARLVGKSNVPTSGFSNVGKIGFKTKVAAFIRSNFFIPDPRKGWAKYAYKKAIELIEQNGINHIVTSSPPHSVQMIGLRLKKRFGHKIKWTADLRDPWTDIYYYNLLNHSFISKRIDAKYEREVVEQCDVLLTLGETFKNTFLSKTTRSIEDKVVLIPNGYDPKNFEHVKQSEPEKAYVITYTGTMADSYEPEIFFRALKRLIALFPEDAIKLKMVGSVSNGVKAFIGEHIGDKASFTPPVSHPEAIQLMCDADLLLLTTPGDSGPVPGKIFEYLAAHKPIIGVGMGDTAVVLERSKAGRSFSRNQEEELFEYLRGVYLNYKNGVLFEPDEEVIKSFSCEQQSLKMIDVVFN